MCAIDPSWPNVQISGRPSESELPWLSGLGKRLEQLEAQVRRLEVWCSRLSFRYWLRPWPSASGSSDKAVEFERAQDRAASSTSSTTPVRRGQLGTFDVPAHRSIEALTAGEIVAARQRGVKCAGRPAAPAGPSTAFIQHDHATRQPPAPARQVCTRECFWLGGPGVRGRFIAFRGRTGPLHDVLVTADQRPARAGHRLQHAALAQRGVVLELAMSAHGPRIVLRHARQTLQVSGDTVSDRLGDTYFRAPPLP